MLDQTSGSFFGPSSLVELLRHRATHQRDELAYVFLADGESDEISLTYGQLDERVRALAARLQSLDLEGRRALLLYPAGLDFVVSFFACLYAGVVAVPAYPPRMNRSLERIEAIAADADAHVALTTSAVWERVAPQLHRTPDLQAVQWLPTDADDVRLDRSLGRSESQSRHAGVPAIHVRLDRHAQGRDAHARQLAAQLRVDRLVLRAEPQGRGRLLAAQLSRHGTGRRHPAAVVFWPSERAHVAGGLLAAAAALAARDQPISGHDQRRSEFRLRFVRSQDDARAARRLGSQLLDVGL